MSDSVEDTENGFPAVQYAFFTAEGGQWVFRGNTVAEVHALLNELLGVVDETDGPGLLSDLQALKAAGVLKEATASKNPNRPPSPGDNGLPAWVLPEAARVLGREVAANEIASGITSKGRNTGKPWYRVGDTFINEPRRNG